MMVRGALGALMLSAGGLAVAGCGGGGGSPADCGNGQSCGVDGGADAGADGSPGTICLNRQPCGGPAATCGTYPPCGGDVVGTWTFVDECESDASIAAIKANFARMAAQSFCVGQTLVGIEPAASGTLVFDAAGTYTLTLVAGGYLDINYPASCLAGLSCDDTTAGFQSQIADRTFPLPTVSTISCTGTSDCLCRATVDSPRSEDGTYSVSGNILTFAASTGIVVDKSYCVEGNALHIVEISTPSSGQSEIGSDLVATKP
jgi:hypothetical protein